MKVVIIYSGCKYISFRTTNKDGQWLAAIWITSIWKYTGKHYLQAPLPKTNMKHLVYISLGFNPKHIFIPTRGTRLELYLKSFITIKSGKTFSIDTK